MNLPEKIRAANIEIHNREAAIYDAVHPEIFGYFEQSKTLKDLALIASMLPEASTVRVLDIGCGTGNLTLKYLRRGHHVTALDISSAMISILKSKVASTDLNRIEFLVGDAEDILTKEVKFGWDIISFSAVLHHLPDYQRVLAQAVKHLRRGGILYVCHEPVPTRTLRTGLLFPVIEQFLDGIDNLFICARKLWVYINHSLRARQVFERFDYTWSDYHIRSGLDAEEILRVLHGMGAKTILYETYKSHYSNLLAVLDAYFAISAHSHFRFIIQRR
jgi:ubiquinone/menaquinone biosynthesis C-methylase UbiE